MDNIDATMVKPNKFYYFGWLFFLIALVLLVLHLVFYMIYFRSADGFSGDFWRYFFSYAIYLSLVCSVLGILGGVGSNEKKKAIIICSVVTLIVGGLYFALVNSSDFKHAAINNAVDKVTDKFIQNPSAYMPKSVPQGQLYEGFPKDLIMDNSAVIISSNYSDSLKEYVTVYNTQKTANDLYDSYLNFFASNGYQITEKQLDNSPQPGFNFINITAKKEKQTVLINASGARNGNGLNIFISVFVK